MATYPSDPALSQFVDAETDIDATHLNELVDNINAIGAALGDIASDDGHIYLGSTKRLYLDGGTTYYITVSSGKTYLYEHLKIAGDLYVDHIYAESASEVTVQGNLDITGTLSKGAGSFKIQHPLAPAKWLLHGFIEGPEYGLLYRGSVQLVDGTATVDIDVATEMTPGTFAAIAGHPTIYLQNQTGFKPVIPSEIIGASFEIRCEDTSSIDSISWLVCAERKDDYVMHDSQTDHEGRLLIEPHKNQLPITMADKELMAHPIRIQE